MTQNAGQCLCGAVKIVIDDVNGHVGACHCDICRRWGRGPLMARECGGDVRIEGRGSVTIYDSSEWAERGFCRKCGTHLFYRLKQAQAYYVPAGLFADENQLQFATQLFVDSKPAYYAFANATREMTGEEVFALFSAEDDGQETR